MNTKSLHWACEMGSSLVHWSNCAILSPSYSWPVDQHTHTHMDTHTDTHRQTPSIPHSGSEDSGKWGQRSCVVIHLSSVTAAANKSLIHRLIHRLSPALPGKQCTPSHPSPHTFPKTISSAPKGQVQNNGKPQNIFNFVQKRREG